MSEKGEAQLLWEGEYSEGVGRTVKKFKEFSKSFERQPSNKIVRGVPCWDTTDNANE